MTILHISNATSRDILINYWGLNNILHSVEIPAYGLNIPIQISDDNLDRFNAQLESYINEGKLLLDKRKAATLEKQNNNLEKERLKDVEHKFENEVSVTKVLSDNDSIEVSAPKKRGSVKK